MGASFMLLLTAADVWHSLLDVLLLLGMALLLGALAERLRQSAIVGYLMAGVLVGSSVLGWVSNPERIFGIAELGVALLLFTIGLEFSPRRLLTMGKVPLKSGPLQVAVTVAAGMLLCLLLGLSFPEAVVIGAMVALSSTACALRMLADRAELDSPHGRTSLGILLVQDVAVVPLMLIVTSLKLGGSPGAIVLRMVVSLALAALLIAVFYGLFNYVVPRLMTLRSLRRNRDLPILLAVFMAVGSAWTAHWLELSPALGAFVAGVLLAVSPFATQVRADIQPLKTVLVTLFFASVGLFADVRWLLDNVWVVAAVVLVIIAGKAAIVTLLVRLCGQPWRFALASGLCVAQVGEFSFVLATIAHGDAPGQGILSQTAFRTLVSATILTLLLTPYLVAAAPAAWPFLERLRKRIKRTADGPDPAESPAMENDADPQAQEGADDSLILILGFGPAGQRIAEDLLPAEQRKMVVVDLNPDNIEIARRYGLAAHIGDATQIEVLEHAGLHQAAVVAITVPTPATSRQLIHLTRQLNPTAFVAVRNRYHVHHSQLVFAGADVVVDEESHVGQRLARDIRDKVTR